MLFSFLIGEEEEEDIEGGLREGEEEGDIEEETNEGADEEEDNVVTGVFRKEEKGQRSDVQA